jgi:hypothetical protein
LRSGRAGRRGPSLVVERHGPALVARGERRSWVDVGLGAAFGVWGPRAPIGRRAGAERGAGRVESRY